jgi:hypothetical protein
LPFGTKVRAEWRALTNAALIGAIVGAGLGAGYLTAGLGEAALRRAETVRVALGPEAGYAAGPEATSGVADQLDRQAGKLRGQLRGTERLPAGLDPDAARVVATKPTHARELDCLAQAVYFEARGESARGQEAVATVIMNRVKNPNFPKTVCGVVYQGSARRHGCQFSFACDGQAERVVERSAWGRARTVAARTLSGAVLRDVGSATHFHTTSVAPGWGSQMLRTAQVGLHVFYRFNPHARRPAPVEAAADEAIFTSAPAAPPPVELRLAEMIPTPEAAMPAAEAKPVLKLPDLLPTAPAKTEAPAPAKPAGAAES